MRCCSGLDKFYYLYIYRVTRFIFNICLIVGIIFVQGIPYSYIFVFLVQKLFALVRYAIRFYFGFYKRLAGIGQTYIAFKVFMQKQSICGLSHQTAAFAVAGTFNGRPFYYIAESRITMALFKPPFVQTLINRFLFLSAFGNTIQHFLFTHRNVQKRLYGFLLGRYRIMATNAYIARLHLFLSGLIPVRLQDMYLPPVFAIQSLSSRFTDEYNFIILSVYIQRCIPKLLDHVALFGYNFPCIMRTSCYFGGQDYRMGRPIFRKVFHHTIFPILMQEDGVVPFFQYFYGLQALVPLYFYKAGHDVQAQFHKLCVYVHRARRRFIIFYHANYFGTTIFCAGLFGQLLYSLCYFFILLYCYHFGREDAVHTGTHILRGACLLLRSWQAEGGGIYFFIHSCAGVLFRVFNVSGQQILPILLGCHFNLFYITRKLCGEYLVVLILVSSVPYHPHYAVYYFVRVYRAIRCFIVICGVQSFILQRYYDSPAYHITTGHHFKGVLRTRGACYKQNTNIFTLHIVIVQLAGICFIIGTIVISSTEVVCLVNDVQASVYGPSRLYVLLPHVVCVYGHKPTAPRDFLYLFGVFRRFRIYKFIMLYQRLLEVCVQRLGCDQNRVVYMCKCDGKRQAQNTFPHAHLVLHAEAPCVFPLAYPKFTIRKGGVYYKLVLFQGSCKAGSVCGVFAFLQLFIFFKYLLWVCFCLDGEGGVVVHAR
ncbi:pQ706L [African swine fever virus]|uniref:PQ706L n=1 Tax=African swine fever virus TaxID=10497 RepID=A0A8A1V0S6_ASF|nr:pQ706L [African swine fever virus]